MTLNAAYPHALSSTAATAPAWTKPCCWVNRVSLGSVSSTRPRSTDTRPAPSVAIIVYRAKLARTRPHRLVGLGLLIIAGSAHQPILSGRAGTTARPGELLSR